MVVVAKGHLGKVSDIELHIGLMILAFARLTEDRSLVLA